MRPVSLETPERGCEDMGLPSAGGPWFAPQDSQAEEGADRMTAENEVKSPPGTALHQAAARHYVLFSTQVILKQPNISDYLDCSVMALAWYLFNLTSHWAEEGWGPLGPRPFVLGRGMDLLQPASLGQYSVLGEEDSWNALADVSLVFRICKLSRGALIDETALAHVT